MSAPSLLSIQDQRFVTGQATLQQLLDTNVGSATGLMLYRGAGGWQSVVLGNGFVIDSTNTIWPNSRSVVVSLAGVVATTGGAIASWSPPEGGPIVVRRCIVVVTTGSTGAANLSVGVAANATTTATNLITATSCHTSAVIIDSITNQITAVAPVALYMSATSAVTFTGSADTSGLVGSALIEYWKP